MSQIVNGRFSSKSDMFKSAINLFRGPTYIGTFLSIDKILREKILITISFANDCVG